MKSIIVIPARYGSTRLPGKPLALISGSSLLKRTWSIAKSVTNVDEVYIATDDARIEAHALEFGANVLMTAPCETGTDRVFNAISQFTTQPDIIINLQGDAVLTPPWVIQALVDAMLTDNSVELATLATKMSSEQYNLLVNSKKNGEVGGTTVVFDLKKNALYFSKSLIPFMRQTKNNESHAYRHIGLYGFRYATLEKFIHLPQSPLELTEGLEQLRALENGIPIRVVEVDYRGRTHWAVDSQEDILMVEKIISAEGELLNHARTST